MMTKARTTTRIGKYAARRKDQRGIEAQRHTRSIDPSQSGYVQRHRKLQVSVQGDDCIKETQKHRHNQQSQPNHDLHKTYSQYTYGDAHRRSKVYKNI